MGSIRYFYMFILVFVFVVVLMIYLIVDSSWYNIVYLVFFLFMYIGIVVVSFGMRDEMLDCFEKWYIYERLIGKCWFFFFVKNRMMCIYCIYKVYIVYIYIGGKYEYYYFEFFLRFYLCVNKKIIKLVYFKWWFKGWRLIIVYL